MLVYIFIMKCWATVFPFIEEFSLISGKSIMLSVILGLIRFRLFFRINNESILIALVEASSGIRSLLYCFPTGVTQYANFVIYIYILYSDRKQKRIKGNQEQYRK